MSLVYWPLTQDYRIFLLAMAFFFALVFISIFFVPEAHPAQVTLAWAPNTDSNVIINHPIEASFIFGPSLK